MEIKKNDIITLNINGMTSEGSGVGRYEGLAVLVPQSAPGDILKVRIIKVSKKYAVGKIEEIIEPSEERCEIDCPVFKVCGGCEFRHITYEAELKHKEQRVKDAIKRIGGLSEEIVSSIIPSESVLRYRNKAQVPVSKNKDGKVIMGFYANHSHRIVDTDDCLLQPEVFTKIQSAFKTWCSTSGNTIYDESLHKGCIRHLYIRYGEFTNEIMVCVVAASKPKNTGALIDELCKIDGVVSILLNINKENTNVVLGNEYITLFGKSDISDKLFDLELSIKPQSFYQVNHKQTEVLYAKAKEYAQMDKNKVLLDLYCGTGTIGLTMVRDAKELYGADIVESAIIDADINAKTLGIDNAHFICADAGKAAEYFFKKGINPDVITIDPPRKGCTPEVIKTLKSMNPEKIVYISCDPATLARDLKLFDEEGYKTTIVTPVDMFPRTANVECVANIIRK